MSVLIKGMEKPKSCTWWDGKCPLLGDDDDCKLQDCQEEWTWQDQYKGCPLSDVSDTNVGDIISRQAAIDTSGLDEEIRCEMCKNPMHTNRGCDGNCKYDEKLYERIMQILDERITPLPSADPEPSQLAKDIARLLENDQDMRVILKNAETKILRCKDCKHIRRWRSEEAAQKFGQIYECAYGVFRAPQADDFCSKAERREDE